jgi:hypothetical protein
MELPNRELFAANQGIREFKLRGHDRRVFCVSGSRSRTPHILAEMARRPRQRLVSNMPLLRSQAEHLVLAGPFGWQVGEADNSHAMREPPVDGGLDEIGREEG